MFAFSQFYSFESVGSSFVSSDAFRKFSLDTTLRPVISSTSRLAMPPAFPSFTAAFLFSSKPCPYQWQRYGSRLRPMLLKTILNLSSNSSIHANLLQTVFVVERGVSKCLGS